MAHVEQDTARSSLGERYRVLLDISHNLGRTLSAEHLYRTIYQETGRVLEVAGFYVALYDRDRDLATVVFYADRGEEKRVEITFRGSDSQVLRTGEGSVVRDRIKNRSLMVLGDEDSEITRSAVSAPLIYEGRVVGALSAQSYEPDAYGDEDLELLQAIADLAAVSINNARHVAEVEARRREAVRIEEIGRAISSSLDGKEVLRKVIDAALELLEADVSTVWLLEEGRARVGASGGRFQQREGASWLLTDFLREMVVECREPVLVRDLRQSGKLPAELLGELRARSGIIVPLVLNDTVTGALSAGKAEVDAFSRGNLNLLERLANQAAVALVNARLHESIQALSLTDPLTRLPNRRHLDIHLRREVAAARRGRPVCLVIFDLDDFKRHNDELGHLAGDEILRDFGKVLLEETRAMNLAARYGGDEFVSVLTEISRRGAKIHVSRVLRRVEADPGLVRYGVTVSFGIAEFDPSTMVEPEDLIQAADEDLYRAKSRRNEEIHGAD